jgi:hypothetical protein
LLGVARGYPALALTLLVARVAADDANDALALDNLALGADGLDAGSNFHGLFSARRDALLVGNTVDRDNDDGWLGDDDYG